jgi:hypothetical protein
LLNKTVDIKFSGQYPFLESHSSGTSKSKDWKLKPINLKVFGSNKIKGHKLNRISKNQRRSPMPEGGEP